MAALFSGCGVQLGFGGHHTQHPREMGYGVHLSGRLHRARASGPYGSWETTMSFAHGMQTSVRSLAFGTGYRIVAASRLRFELGPELALGMPVTTRYSRTGLFTGGSTDVLFRISGDQDNMVGFAPIGMGWDAVLAGRGGYWTRGIADRGPGTWEWGIELGIRLTFISDLLVAQHEGWEGPWDKH